MEKLELAGTIEEMCMEAWPSFERVLMDGWTLRFADGYTFRSNSVQPIHPGIENVVEKIRCCEDLYFRRGLPAAFKISPIMQPPELDSILESLGYRMHTPTSVQVLDALPGRPTGDSDIECLPLSEWLDAFSIVTALPAERKPLHAGILERIALPICTIVAKHDGEPAACGLGVLHGDYVGLYDICTAPSMRRTGLATKIIHELLCWASDADAVSAYLSVVEANTPAIGLYRKLGFRHVYSYWYRIKDRDAT